MTNSNLRAFAFGIALAATAAVVAAHSHEEHGRTAFGEPGDPKKSSRVVHVVMREDHAHMLFAPDRIEVKKGEQIRFVLDNEGIYNHEFVLGTQRSITAHAAEMKKNPDMEHDDAHSLRLGPYSSGELTW